MSRADRTKAFLLLALAGGMGWAAATHARPGGDGSKGEDPVPLESLLQQRESLRRDVEMLRLETSLAKTKAAYAVLDPSGLTLSFRVRGRTMKQYPIKKIYFEPGPWGRESIPEGVFGRVYKLEDRIGKEIPVLLGGAAARAETKAAGAAGEPGEGAGAAGSEKPETESTATMIAPDPPPRFLWRLEGGLSIYVMDDAVPQDPWARRAERCLVWAKRLGRLWMALGPDGSGGQVVYMIMEADESRQAYRSLLPRLQSIVILTPSQP